eukprot:8156400-Pyramimonas_sp.AAC.1
MVPTGRSTFFSVSMATDSKIAPREEEDALPGASVIFLRAKTELNMFFPLVGAGHGLRHVPVVVLRQ